MKDYYSFILIISVSIIISISITLFIYYKNANTNYLETNSSILNKSTKTNNKFNDNLNEKLNEKFNGKLNSNIIENFDIKENSNIKENFETMQELSDQQTIAINNKTINSLLAQLNNAPIVISPNVNTINKNFINSISSNISSLVNNITNIYSSSNSSFNNNITVLENNLTDLENMITNMNLQKVKKQSYTRIKSLNNGMDMSIINTPNTYFPNLKTGSNTAAYLLKMNNGCLSVGTNEYDVYKCNDKNSKQYFQVQNILNETDYTNNIEKVVPFDNIDKSSIVYPFAMVKSVNNENCLTNNHGSITVQPCSSLVAQRWMPL